MFYSTGPMCIVATKYQGQMDRGLFYWPNLSGETRLSNKEEEE